MQKLKITKINRTKAHVAIAFDSLEWVQPLKCRAKHSPFDGFCRAKSIINNSVTTWHHSFPSPSFSPSYCIKYSNVFSPTAVNDLTLRSFLAFSTSARGLSY